MTPILQFKKVCAGYKDLKILHDVDAELNKGEIVSLIGPNGAGKSTLIKTVYCFAKLFFGKIVYTPDESSEEIQGMNPWEMTKKRIAYVNQGRVVFSTLTVEENLNIAASRINKDKEMIQEEKEKVFALFPMLKDKRKSVAFYLSGGQQQQLALARALVQKPLVLLLDEPTLGLNPALQAEVFQKIKNMRDEMGISTLMVEQNAKQAIAMSDRTYLLENGKIVLSGGKEIIENPKIKKVYLGG